MTAHFGVSKIAFPDAPVAYFKCWCGARWLCPAAPAAHRWCPSAPVGLDALPPDSVLLVSVTRPEWAAGSTMPFVVDVQVGSVSTTLASAATLKRAMMLAVALRKAHGDTPGGFRQTW